MDTHDVTWRNKVSFGLVLLMIGAVGFMALGVLAAAAGADDEPVAVRDSGSGHDGDDDGDDDNSGPGSGDDDTGTDGNSGPGGGDDTATGTTQGTGASNTGTAGTNTGTRTAPTSTGTGQG